MSSLFNIQSRHQHYIERYKTGQVNLIDAYIRRIIKSLNLRLSEQNTILSQKKREEVLKYIELLSRDELKKFTTEISDNMKEFGLAQAEFSAKSLAKVGVEIGNIPTLQQIYSAALKRPFTTKLLRNVLDDFSKDQARFIRNTISTGFVEGETNAQIVKRIVGSSNLQYKDGALNVVRRHAETMTRTAIQHISSTAQQELYKANDDLFTKYEWVSTLDSRTSALCQSLDGKILTVGKGRIPPAHYACRSTTIPVFDEDIKIVNGVKVNTNKGLRGSVGSGERGQVSAKLNYNDWLKKQSNDFQDDVLGKTKAKLFRKGGLSVDKFIDRKDKSLTLKQLKQTYPTAWDKAMTRG